jgi:anti-anti-sigma factor
VLQDTASDTRAHATGGAHGVFSADVRRATNDVAHLVLGGELDMAGVDLLRRRALEAAKENACVVVDMSALAFIDSTGIVTLLELAQRAAADGWTLRLVPGPTAVQRPIALLGLDQHLPFLEEQP